MPNAKNIHGRRASVVRTARQHTITPTRMYTAEVTQSRITTPKACPPTSKTARAAVVATSATSRAVAAFSRRRSRGASTDASGSREVRMAALSDVSDACLTQISLFFIPGRSLADVYIIDNKCEVSFFHTQLEAG